MVNAKIAAEAKMIEARNSTNCVLKIIETGQIQDSSNNGYHLGHVVHCITPKFDPIVSEMIRLRYIQLSGGLCDMVNRKSRSEIDSHAGTSIVGKN